MAEHEPRPLERLETALARLEAAIARKPPPPSTSDGARIEAAAREALARLDRLLAR